MVEKCHCQLLGRAAGPHQVCRDSCRIRRSFVPTTVVRARWSMRLPEVTPELPMVRPGVGLLATLVKVAHSLPLPSSGFCGAVVEPRLRSVQQRRLSTRTWRKAQARHEIRHACVRGRPSATTSQKARCVTNTDFESQKRLVPIGHTSIPCRARRSLKRSAKGCMTAHPPGGSITRQVGTPWSSLMVVRTSGGCHGH